MLESYILLAPMIPKLVGTDKICVWASDEEKMILFENYGKLNIPLQKGSKLLAESTPTIAMKNNEVIDRIVPRDVYGSTFRSVCVPVPGGTIGLSIDIEDKNKVIESLELLSSTSSEVAASAHDIANYSTNVNERIESVTIKTRKGAEKREELENILKVLNNITEQLKILSLNAMIEASRAGNSGLAFKVVANEVKRLAEESKERLSNTMIQIRDVNDLLKHIDDELVEINQLASDQNKQSTEISATIQSVSSTVEQLYMLAEKMR